MRVPFCVSHLVTVCTDPRDVLYIRTTNLAAAEETSPAQARMFAAQCDDATGELKEMLMLRVEVPVVPADFIILAICVVVAALRASNLIAATQHRYALRE